MPWCVQRQKCIDACSIMLQCSRSLLFHRFRLKPWFLSMGAISCVGIVSFEYLAYNSWGLEASNHEDLAVLFFD
eukprot:4096123-Amphidinium_carterae.1